MLNGTVGTTCQYHAVSNVFDINISALINNSWIFCLPMPIPISINIKYVI